VAGGLPSRTHNDVPIPAVRAASQLLGHVRHEQHGRGSDAQGFRDPPIAAGGALGTGGGVEVAVEERGEIPFRRVLEEQALGEHAARREDGDGPALPAPPFERRPHVRIDVPT